MIIAIRNSIIAKLTCWILLLQVINLSIDPPDLKLSKNNFSAREDLRINEVESVYELIAEGVFENDVPENDDHDIDTKSQGFDLYCFDVNFINLPVIAPSVEHYSAYHTSDFFARPEPSSPPPKQA